MEERSLRVLEYPLFLQGLRTFASSEVGQALCLSLRPSSIIDQLENQLQEVKEASDLLQQDRVIPVDGLEEIRPLLTEARAEGTTLSPEALLRVRSTAGAAGRVRQFFRSDSSPSPRLKARGDDLPDLRNLHSELHRALGPRGEILDSSSPELGRIRREISLVRSRIRRSLESLWEREDLNRIFQEQLITLRNDRYVVPVKAEFKNTLPGIIHDHSQSRATFFIEPLSTLEENNELNVLVQDEKEEERRILLELTDRVREESDPLRRAVEGLGQLDLVLAKARWALKFRATFPSYNRRGGWRLFNARHPLLEPGAVPIDLALEPGQSTLIISGANAGGKTAALKTVGLLTLIAQSGLPVPADDGSEVAVFQDIFADIGDEQNLQENLSTFSAWIRTVSRILRESDSSSLVLLDEVGGGTDPLEGAALTMALLDGLRERGARIVVTTHLHLLKAYGAIHPDVINVSVDFDPETLRPSYRLVYGRPGESHALVLGERWGLPREIVEKAYGYMGEGERKVSQLLQSLEQSQHELERKTEETETLRREAENFRRQAEAAVRETRREEERILSRAREEGQGVVREARQSLRDLINEFKARGRTDVHRLGQAIDAEEEKLGRWTSPRNGDLRSAAAAPDSSSSSLNRLKEAFADKTGKGKKGSAAQKRGWVDYRIPSAPREINIIGLRVEEAMPLVDKALDEAFLGGLKEMEIIHGAGTGRLRQAIREHLEDHPLVKSFAPGGPGRGGNGATVVEIGSAPSDKPGRHRSGKSGAQRGS